MGLRTVDLNKPVQPIEWLVPGLVPKGFLSFLGSLPGEGKTALLTSLAWQLSRPRGEFLGYPLQPAKTIYLDFDAPAEGRSLRSWLERHSKTFPDGELNAIQLLEPQSDTFGLGDAEAQELVQLATLHGAGLIVLDSFMAAFPGVDPVKLVRVMGPMWHLRNLAEKTGAAIVLIDHLPKPVGGEKAGARGVLGSTAKPAQARSVHILTRVPFAQVEGRHVLRWETTKNSFGKQPEPFGIELQFVGEGLRIVEAELPAEYADTRTDIAARAIQNRLESTPGEVVGNTELMGIAIKGQNLSERSAKKAVKAALERYGDRVQKVSLPGRGGPVGYVLKAEADTTASPVPKIEESASGTALISGTPSVPQMPISTPNGVSEEWT